MTKKYERKDLEALWQKEVDDGETRLTYNEWAARFIMEQSKKDAKPPKKKAVDKKKATTKKQSTATKKDAKSTENIPLLDDNGISTLGTPKSPPKQAVLSDEAKALDLTTRQEMFCREYIKDYNATRAAIAAGYAKDSAHVAGSRLLSNVKIQKFLSTLQKPKLEKLDADADWILSEYRKMAGANLGRFFAKNDDGTLKTIGGLPYFDFDGMHYEDIIELGLFEVVQLPAFAEGEPEPLKIKLKLNDKKHALDVLAKRAGLLKEYVEHSGELALKDVDDKTLAMRVAFMLRKAQEDGKNKD